jgi:hypothetical protein
MSSSFTTLAQGESRKATLANEGVRNGNDSEGSEEGLRYSAARIQVLMHHFLHVMKAFTMEKQYYWR